MSYMTRQGPTYYKRENKPVSVSLPSQVSDLPEPGTDPTSAANSDTQSIYWSIRSRLSLRSFIASSTFTNSTGQYSQPGAQWREALVLTMSGGFGQSAPRDGKSRPVIEGRETAPRGLSRIPGISRTGRAPRAVPKSMLRALGLALEDEYSPPQQAITIDTLPSLDAIGEVDENFQWQDVKETSEEDLDEAQISARALERWWKLHEIWCLTSGADEFGYFRDSEDCSAVDKLEKLMSELSELAKPPCAFTSNNEGAWAAIRTKIYHLRAISREYHDEEYTDGTRRKRLAILKEVASIVAAIPDYATLDANFTYNERRRWNQIYSLDASSKQRQLYGSVAADAESEMPPDSIDFSNYSRWPGSVAFRKYMAIHGPK